MIDGNCLLTFRQKTSIIAFRKGVFLMKRILSILMIAIMLCFFTGCGSSSSYDYDKGYGYTAPKDGDSFSDYFKRQDPDLYNNVRDRWNSLK